MKGHVFKNMLNARTVTKLEKEVYDASLNVVNLEEELEVLKKKIQEAKEKKQEAEKNLEREQRRQETADLIAKSEENAAKNKALLDVYYAKTGEDPKKPQMAYYKLTHYKTIQFGIRTGVDRVEYLEVSPRRAKSFKQHYGKDIYAWDAAVRVTKKEAVKAGYVEY